MAETYRAVMLTRKGGPEVLETVTLPVTEPGPGEVRIRVRAVGAGYTDAIMRSGTYVFAPKIPFVPGYDTVGEVEALGPGVTSLRLGQRVAGLTVWGGYAEKLIRKAEEFVPVPDGLDDAEVVALILNYVTAYQAIHRVAEVKPGQQTLVTGASGGVGSALVELLRVHGAPAIGAASTSHHDFVRGLGATPVESRGAPLDRLVRALVPDGVDVAFDGIGGKVVGECIGALKRGGLLTWYGFTAGVVNGKAKYGPLLRGVASVFLGAPLRGRRQKFYGITALYQKDPRPFREDLPKLFDLLAQRKIQPAIATKLPLLDGRRANEMLDKGGVRGKIVLVA
jgi:NADPH2:quinone reductase